MHHRSELLHLWAIARHLCCIAMGRTKTNIAGGHTPYKETGEPVRKSGQSLFNKVRNNLIISLCSISLAAGIGNRQQFCTAHGCGYILLACTCALIWAAYNLKVDSSSTHIALIHSSPFSLLSKEIAPTSTCASHRKSKRYLWCAHMS